MSGIVGETWRPIPGIEGYEVSDHGRVRSLDRWVQYMNGRRHRRKGRMLTPDQDSRGRMRLSLGSKARSRIHQLVALAFIGPCPDGMEVAHNDGNPSNNRLANLRYDTHSGNHDDRHRHGTMLEGNTATNRTLTAAQAIAIYASKGIATAASLAAEYNCAPSTIKSLWQGRSWRHVTGAPSPDPRPSSGNTSTTDATLPASSAPTTH